MKTIPAQSVLANIRSNAFGAWARGSDDDSPGDDPTLAGHRVQRPFSWVNPKRPLVLGSAASIFALGSCFAREIECAFARRGHAVLSNDDDYLLANVEARPPQQTFNATDFASDQPWGPGTYINRYTTPSLLLELQRSIGTVELPDDAMLLRGPGGIVDLHFANTCHAGDLELVQRRRAITREVTRRILQADLVVITLGLTEAWYDRESRAYINSAPPRQALQDDDRFEARCLGFEDNLGALEEAYRLVRQSNPAAQVVLTVSPVPLRATATDEDVIIANMASKSILRAVVAEFCAAHDEVAYFPSYEIVCHSDPAVAWRGDRRHVAPAMVDYIVKAFCGEGTD